MNKADVMPNSLKYGLVLRYSKLDTVEYSKREFVLIFWEETEFILILYSNVYIKGTAYWKGYKKYVLTINTERVDSWHAIIDSMPAKFLEMKPIIPLPSANPDIV